ncbi:hypothetical protein [Spirosoma sp. KUDC1026]|uniref:hypothetical protein n=1 Tax=Spirosoma sp. KUDC1026 TaxID=2745947 RepID=UPI001E621BF6|nr:hypothetical protein [Spirosoma sp. KUDC1026]
MGLSLLTLAQVNLKYRLLSAYSLSPDASVNKTKTTLYIFDSAESLNEIFTRSTPAPKQATAPNFTKETAIGIVLPPTNTLPKISISRVFVQDSTLTIRYIRMKDTSQTKTIQPVKIQPTLLLAIPRQTVLKTRLIENGKLIQTIRSNDDK